VTDTIEYYSVTRAISVVNRADIVVLLIDAKEGISEQDKKIADFFRISEGKKVLKLERLRGGPDGPFVYFIHTFIQELG